MKGPPPRIVPWTSLDEWRFVRDGLFTPKDDEQQVMALQMVSVWIVKGRVPTAVEGTANLVQVARLDLKLTNGTMVSDDVVLKLAYASAITRFVNEAVDPFQRGQVAAPISRIAEQLNLPRLLVDIRHESVHDALPSMQILRLAAEESLGWLWSNYWLPQSSFDELLTDRITTCVHHLGAALKCKSESDSLGRLVRRALSDIENLFTNIQVHSILVEVALAQPDVLIALGEWTGLEEIGHLFGPCLVNSLIGKVLADSVYRVGKDSLLACLTDSQAADQSMFVALRLMVSEMSPRALDVAHAIHASQKLSLKLSELFLSIKEHMSLAKSISPTQAIKTIEMVNSEEQACLPITGWAVASVWRPCSIGCTPDYNPTLNFMSLWCFQ